MRGDTFVTDLGNGHKLYMDKWQWIVQHSWKCKNATGHTGGENKRTFLNSNETLAWELNNCKVKMPKLGENGLPRAFGSITKKYKIGVKIG